MILAQVAFPFRWFDIYRHSGASRHLAALLDSGFRRRDGLPAKPPETKRCPKRCPAKNFRLTSAPGCGNIAAQRLWSDFTGRLL